MKIYSFIILFFCVLIVSPSLAQSYQQNGKVVITYDYPTVQPQSAKYTSYGIRNNPKVVRNVAYDSYNTIYDSNGQLTYEGQMRNGKQHGYGRMWFNGGYYEGTFYRGMAHGQGKDTYANGDRYEGEFRYNKRQGLGTYYYANRERYEGNFQNDKMHGKGTYYLANGQYFTGIWHNGRLMDQTSEKYAGYEPNITPVKNTYGPQQNNNYGFVKSMKIKKYNY